jgi:hypothetical protein
MSTASRLDSFGSFLEKQIFTYKSSPEIEFYFYFFLFRLHHHLFIINSEMEKYVSVFIFVAIVLLLIRVYVFEISLSTSPSIRSIGKISYLLLKFFRQIEKTFGWRKRLL